MNLVRITTPFLEEDFKMDRINVSIVIPTKNEGDIIERCLSSIQKMDYSREEYEVIIVDGYSTDNSVEIAKKYGCKVIYENSGVIGGARNIGVEHSRGKYIVFTDADCIVERRWLKKLLKNFEDSNVVSVGGPNITPDDDNDFAKCVGTVLSLLSKVGARYGFNENAVREIYHNPTCNVAYRKDYFKEVGGFNEKLVTCDDEELDYRLREKRYKILYVPDLGVLHYRRSTWRKMIKMAFTYGVGRMQAIKLHWKMGKWFHYTPSAIIVLIFLFFAVSCLTPISPLISLFILFVGGVGIGVISLHLAIKERKSYFILFGLIFVWFWGYGFGMLRGTLK